MTNFTTLDLLHISTMMFGPALAVGLGFFLNNFRAKRIETREKKVEILRVLMTTRADTTSMPHVNALNQIDLAFHENNPKDKAVTESWKIYLDHLRKPNANWRADQWDRWGEQKVELLLDLMHTMAKNLGYSFDRSHLKTTGYLPTVYESIENENAAIRRGVIEVLGGSRSIPMHVGPPPQSQERTPRT